MTAILISSQPYTLTQLPDKKPRSPGFHLGAIVQDKGQALGFIPMRRPSPPGRKEAYFDCGFTWEDALEREFKRRQAIRSVSKVERERSHMETKKGWSYVTQCECDEEGIFMTPDLVWLLKMEAQQLDEFKWTFSTPPKNPAKLLEEKWAWRVSTHCYARAVGVNRVRFVVCWVGRYPDPIEYIFEYNTRDMDTEWNMVLEHRDLIVKKRRTLV